MLGPPKRMGHTWPTDAWSASECTLGLFAGGGLSSSISVAGVSIAGVVYVEVPLVLTGLVESKIPGVVPGDCASASPMTTSEEAVEGGGRSVSSAICTSSRR